LQSGYPSFEQAKHASPQTKSLLCRVSEQTHQETKDGIAGKGMTLVQLRTRYGSGPSMSCCVLSQHGILQGKKQAKCAAGMLLIHADGLPLMVDKIRLVDNSKRSLTNSCLMRCCETIAACQFTFVATVAEEIVFQSQALGLTTLSSIVFIT